MRNWTSDGNGHLGDNAKLDQRSALELKATKTEVDLVPTPALTAGNPATRLQHLRQKTGSHFDSPRATAFDEDVQRIVGADFGSILSQAPEPRVDVNLRVTRRDYPTVNPDTSIPPCVGQ